MKDIWRFGLLAALVALAVWFFISAAAAHDKPYAVDGDTIRQGNETIRILGLDTPETFQPQCELEARLGYAAAGRLQGLMNRRVVRIERTGDLDKYGRTLAKVFVGKDNAADLLIAEDLGRAYSGGKRMPWCPAGEARPGAY